jgi:hypothetical protein
MTGSYRRYCRRWRRPASAPRSFARKALDFVLMAIFFALVALLVAKLNKRAPVEPLIGKAYVIDGDTISISGNHIRLKGIDAPELTQSCGNVSAPDACGQASRQTLIRLIGGRECSVPETVMTNIIAASQLASSVTSTSTGQWLRLDKRSPMAIIMMRKCKLVVKKKGYGPAHSRHRRIGARNMRSCRNRHNSNPIGRQTWSTNLLTG